MPDRDHLDDRTWLQLAAALRVAMRRRKAMAEMTRPWEAPDGTRWLWFPRFGEWHGWMPGEDGLWILTPEEFRDSYPGWPDEHIEG